MSRFSEIQNTLHSKSCTWLVTGVAGFIGSHLLEHLLKLNQNVVGLDNFSTGSRENLDAVKSKTGKSYISNFNFHEGDIRDSSLCEKVSANIDFVLHQAALGSVPRSIKEPELVYEVNVQGFVNILTAAKNKGVKKFIFASSSSVYGDSEILPKKEEALGKPLSPYAATKRMNEIWAEAFHSAYKLETIGLRYFNVFGPRQNPFGEYAAVIPRWIRSSIKGEACTIYGDGFTTRDFCYVENVVQANLCAAFSSSEVSGQAYNIASSEVISLTDLHQLIAVSACGTKATQAPIMAPFRNGDVRHSKADISKALLAFGYAPTVDLKTGLSTTISQLRS